MSKNSNVPFVYGRLAISDDYTNREKEIFSSALSNLIDQLSLLFTNIIDSLTARQIGFLSAVAFGESSFSSKEVLKKHDLGTSANIKNLKNVLLEKDLIDILPENKIVIQDPAFEYWIKIDWSK